VCGGVFCSHAGAIVGGKIFVKDKESSPWLGGLVAKLQGLISTEFAQHCFLQ